MTFLDHLERVCAALNHCDVPFVIGGSLASSLWGHVRQTNDADLAIFATTSTPECLRQQLGLDYIIFPSDWTPLFEETDFPCGDITFVGGGFRCDLFLAPASEFSRLQFQRAVRADIGFGVAVPISSPEDTVLVKLRWYELGNRVSDRQWNDIVQVLEVQAGRLDLEYLERWAKHFGVDELLALAIEQSDPFG